MATGAESLAVTIWRAESALENAPSGTLEWCRIFSATRLWSCPSQKSGVRWNSGSSVPEILPTHRSGNIIGHWPHFAAVAVKAADQAGIRISRRKKSAALRQSHPVSVVQSHIYLRASRVCNDCESSSCCRPVNGAQEIRKSLMRVIALGRRNGTGLWAGTACAMACRNAP